ncbi:MAG TPA: DNA mismatch repair protein MutS, partial [Thermodesulfobacteriota bacterium]|nr:DNA mismatch repair protein MutS [Thermodesulfobacteriota bacterium]
MKVFLMHKERDFDPEEGLPPNAAALTQDLELDMLFDAMAAGDKFLLEVAKKAVFASLDEPEAILYRQRILADCLERPAIAREMYAIAVEAIEREKKVWGWGKNPEGVLHRSVEVLKLFVGLLKRLRRIADAHGADFRSEGLATLFRMLAGELDDEYLGVVEDHLRRLEFRDGILISAELDDGNKGTRYVLRKPWNPKQSWMERLQARMERLFLRDRSDYVVQIADRDEGGFRALAELRSRGIGPAAGALGESTDHILGFFRMLRSELGFYVGCLNLRDRLAGKGEPICFPEPFAAGKAILSCRGLYDLCLSLSVKERVVGNDVSADDKLLVMITGANRGGKSTFLRGIGLAQLMMQCGMFVPAESFRANVCDGIFTHYKREEDSGMQSGKLDEELSRMSSIVDGMTPNSIVLLNESFASTNEREGSEIARQIVRALLETGIKVVYVTHLFDLAQGFFLAKMDAALFLRAERLADGRRTFRLVEGEPLPTSYGEDLYRRIFGAV